MGSEWQRAKDAPVPRWPGVILAGGRSRRMGGGDKALAPFRGRPLIQEVIDRLTPQVTALAINANDTDGALARFGLPVLPDPVAERPGPLAGILAAMLWAGAGGARFVLTAPCDAPFLPVDLAGRLDSAYALSGKDDPGRPVLAGDAEGSAAAARPGGGRHPVIGLWPVVLAPALHDALSAGMRRVADFADAQGAVTLRFAESVDGCFDNINTPVDLARAASGPI